MGYYFYNGLENGRRLFKILDVDKILFINNTIKIKYQADVRLIFADNPMKSEIYSFCCIWKK